MKDVFGCMGAMQAGNTGAHYSCLEGHDVHGDGLPDAQWLLC